MSGSLRVLYGVVLLSMTLCIAILLTALFIGYYETTAKLVLDSSETVVRRALIEQVARRGTSMVDSVSANLVNPLYYLDVRAIGELTRTAREQPDVVYFLVADADGRVIHDGTPTLMRYGDLLDDDLSRQAIREWKTHSRLNGDLLEVAAPVRVGQKLVGIISAGIRLGDVTVDLARLRETLLDINRIGRKRYLLLTLASLGVLLLIAAVISGLVARSLSRPIYALLTQTREVAAGRYDMPLPFQRRDELGQLATGLARMAKQIKRTTVSSEYFTNILESLQDGVLVLDRQGTITYANGAAVRMAEAGAGGLIGVQISQMVLPEREERLDAHLAAIGQAGSRQVFHGSVITGREENVPVRLSASLSRDTRSADAQVVVVMQDLRPLRRKEFELRLSEERYRMLIDILPLGVREVDSAGTVLNCNRSYARMMGIDVADAVDHPFWQDVQAEDVPRVRSLMTDLNQPVPRAPNPLVVRQSTAEGKTIEVEIHWAVKHHEHVESSRLVLVSADVTEQRALEANLRDAQRRESIGRLAGGVAHEFNNLLQIVLGFTAIALGSDRLPEETRQHLHEVCSAAERGRQLVKQLLGYSGRQTLVRKPLALNECVAAMAGLMKSTLSRTIEVRTDLDKRVGRILADKGMVDQILMNLCLNAQEAMPDGGILMLQTGLASGEGSVRASPEDGENYAVVTVQDTGTGMTDEVISRLFEPFFTTKEAHKGTGLGMAMVQGLVDLHGGRIEIDSTPGVGSTFRVYLPRALTQDEPAPPDATRLGVFAGRRGVVLVADDEAPVRQQLELLLGELRCDVVLAEDGDAAVREFEQREREIVLVVMDMMMPRRTGIEVLRHIRARRPNMPVIMQSGYALRASDRHYLERNGVTLLSKPFLPDELKESVLALLDANTGNVQGV